MPQFTIPKGSFVNLFRNPITGRGGGADPTDLMAQLQGPGYGYGGGSTKGFYSQGDKALAPDQFGAGRLHPLLYTQGLISGQNTDPYLAGYWQERPTELASTYNILNQGEFGGFDPKSFLPPSSVTGPNPPPSEDQPLFLPGSEILEDPEPEPLPPYKLYDPTNFLNTSNFSEEDLEQWEGFFDQLAGGANQMEALRNFTVPPSATTSRNLLGEAVGSAQALDRKSVV